MDLIKLNVGASPIWEKAGWHTLDHKVREETEYSFGGDAAAIPVPDLSCETVFCSHMFEHIPHTRLETILLEFNRVLSPDGVLRVLLPDLKKVAEAYVNGDAEFFREAKEEDESLRTDLGFGGMFMNFIVSPGQDTALMNRGLNQFIAGYAHLYSYDFEMMKILLERSGFGDVRQMEFCQSSYPDYEEPLHVKGLEPVWENFNQAFYKKHNLVHRYDDKSGHYEITFKVTGFDRDPLTSLIVEAKKDRHVDASSYQSLNDSKKNYNRYAWSLLRDPTFSKRLDDVVRSAEPEQ
ncbi:MAG: methyltransferase domain-containing protein [Chloroflexi bacterium]|nr:methyltransferase domain-containing protein [Chloroflexota bacterium]